MQKTTSGNAEASLIISPNWLMKKAVKIQCVIFVFLLITPLMFIPTDTLFPVDRTRMLIDEQIPPDFLALSYHAQVVIVEISGLRPCEVTPLNHTWEAMFWWVGYSLLMIQNIPETAILVFSFSVSSESLISKFMRTISEWLYLCDHSVVYISVNPFYLWLVDPVTITSSKAENISIGGTANLECFAKANPAVAATSFLWRRFIAPEWNNDGPLVTTTTISCGNVSPFIKMSFVNRLTLCVIKITNPRTPLGVVVMKSA